MELYSRLKQPFGNEPLEVDFGVSLFFLVFGAVFYVINGTTSNMIFISDQINVFYTVT